MALLLLVRHAVTDATGKHLSGRTRGIHLSEAGRAQADRLVERLAGVPIKAFYSSPLERCVETARPPARARGLDVRVESRLVEGDYGSWTGRSMAQLVRTTLWKQVQASPSAIRFPDGETLGEVQLRTVEALDDIAARHPRDVVAAVAPGERTSSREGKRGARLVTLLVEKGQVRQLAAAVVEILARIGADPSAEADTPTMDLEPPLEPEWRAGRLAIGYEEDRDLL